MAINRRNFFRALGITGVALGTGKELNAVPEKGMRQSFTESFTIPPGVWVVRVVKWPVPWLMVCLNPIRKITPHREKSVKPMRPGVQ